MIINMMYLKAQKLMMKLKKMKMKNDEDRDEIYIGEEEDLSMLIFIIIKHHMLTSSKPLVNC